VDRAEAVLADQMLVVMVAMLLDMVVAAAAQVLVQAEMVLLAWSFCPYQLQVTQVQLQVRQQ
jgi:hypothetical protein